MIDVMIDEMTDATAVIDMTTDTEEDATIDVTIEWVDVMIAWEDAMVVMPHPTAGDEVEMIVVVVEDSIDQAVAVDVMIEEVAADSVEDGAMVAVEAAAAVAGDLEMARDRKVARGKHQEFALIVTLLETIVSIAVVIAVDQETIVLIEIAAHMMIVATVHAVVAVDVTCATNALHLAAMEVIGKQSDVKRRRSHVLAYTNRILE